MPGPFESEESFKSMMPTPLSVFMGFYGPAWGEKVATGLI